MKIKSYCVMFCAAFFLVLVSVSGCLAQSEDDEAGGYVSVSTTDRDVRTAADFAVRESAKKQSAAIRLISIKRAQMQVVAGRNFDLCIQISFKGGNDEEATEMFVRAVVYRNLRDVYSLTSWAEEDCAE